MLSSRAQYAVIAMLQLAQEQAGGEPVQVRRIAERHAIPPTFLVQILHDLRRSGLVTSTRGAAGGYRLNNSPSEITLADIVDAFETAEEPAGCAAADSPWAGALHEVCCELIRARRERLQSITLAELADRTPVGTGPMWYI
jgi:Rrf2 family cysteine metabolism transcriptional repressor